MDECPPSVLELNVFSKSRARLDRTGEQAGSTSEQSLSTPVYWSAKLGYAWEPPLTSAYHLGVDIGVLFRPGGEQIIAGLGLGLSTSTTDSTVPGADGDAGVDVSMTTIVLPVALEVGWRKVLSPRARLVLLGQVGLAHIENSSGGRNDGGNFSSGHNGNQGLLGFGAHTEWTAGPGNILGGARYVWYPGSFEKFDGVYSALFLDVGYRFWFE